MPTHKSNDYKLSAVLNIIYLILKIKYIPVKYLIVLKEV